MHGNDKIEASDKNSFYRELLLQFEGLMSDEKDWLASLSNTSALLYQNLPHVNWAGFYLYKEGMLVLGPFQGKVACTRIEMGKGVCGTAAREKETCRVLDVHKFPGHIACDSASNSEIVVPIIKNDAVVGVLDIDSPSLERFDETDQLYLENIVKKLEEYIDWSKIS
ncbi:free methionine-R-sulfoxide reductase [Oxobacter pfennigii]|uniref:Free methionine-R-sulfoxide reductase n=1 Tax=Oxobacter pfennigii TaxID=36849 RepID=A0A0P8X5T9_9CLOT|nr:GAF domain-containing protein [Oxobacter pfennigii]KPU46258.1 free methionine-R-sulfoxide reductase [Oxobacter pfennigii]